MKTLLLLSLLWRRDPKMDLSPLVTHLHISPERRVISLMCVADSAHMPDIYGFVKCESISTATDDGTIKIVN